MPHTNPVIQGAGFHHMALRTGDFDRSMEFYVDLLGCKPHLAWGPADQRSRAVMLDIGDGNYIEVFERPESSSDAIPAEARYLHLCLRCANVEQVVERVRAAGFRITVEPKDAPVRNTAKGGGPADVTLHLAFFTGPDGEVIELIDCADL